MIRQLIPYSSNIPLGHHFKLEDEMDEILRWEASEIVKSKDLRMINPTTSDRWGGLAANGTPYVAGVKKDLIPELVQDGLKDLLQMDIEMKEKGWRFDRRLNKALKGAIPALKQSASALDMEESKAYEIAKKYYTYFIEIWEWGSKSKYIIRFNRD